MLWDTPDKTIKVQHTYTSSQAGRGDACDMRRTEADKMPEAFVAVEIWLQRYQLRLVKHTRQLKFGCNDVISTGGFSASVRSNSV